MPQESSENGQAGVEVTPEMIEAGADVLLEWDTETETAWDAASKVFCVMAAVEGIRAAKCSGSRKVSANL